MMPLEVSRGLPLPPSVTASAAFTSSSSPSRAGLAVRHARPRLRPLRCGLHEQSFDTCTRSWTGRWHHAVGPSSPTVFRRPFSGHSTGVAATPTERRRGTSMAEADS